MTVSVDSMSPEEVNAEIQNLHEFIIPPIGTSKADIDAVFGVPKEYKERPSGGIILYNFPLHTYQLLDPKPNQEFRAILCVNYKEDKVVLSSINHMCVVKNRVVSIQSPERQKAIEAENRHVLEDLIEIEKKYKKKLQKTSWNN